MCFDAVTIVFPSHVILKAIMQWSRPLVSWYLSRAELQHGHANL
jgi:hypothetical protein